MAKLYQNDTIGSYKGKDKLTISKEYEAALKDQHSSEPKWGSTSYRYGGADIITMLEQRKYITTVLDYGCGKGTLKDWLPQYHPNVQITEYDPGIPGKDVLPSGQFDLVITCDVLEHVEYSCIDDTIRQLAEKTRLVMYNNIACSLTGKLFQQGPYKGQDLHLIVEHPNWWNEKFAKVLGDTMELFEYRHIERRRQGKLQNRAVLVHEKG